MFRAVIHDPIKKATLAELLCLLRACIDEMVDHNMTEFRFLYFATAEGALTLDEVVFANPIANRERRHMMFHSSEPKVIADQIISGMFVNDRSIVPY